MNNVKNIILAFFIACASVVCANAQEMGFYTIKKKTEAKEVVALREKRHAEVARGDTGLTDVLASADSIRHLEDTSSGRRTAPAKMLFSQLLESDTIIVNSPYGYRQDPITGKRRFHAGVDLWSSSDNVYAMMPGKVSAIGYNRSLGNYVRLDHGDITVTYGHLLTTVGKKGDEVMPGQSVGITGSTGRSTGEHLHVAVKVRGKSVDPLPILMYVNNYVHSVRDFRPKEEP